MKQKKIYWFTAKQYGFGWMPSVWQGWLILFVYLGSLMYSFFSIDSRSHSGSDTMINFLPTVFFASIVLLVICILTGEPPKWRWGGKK